MIKLFSAQKAYSLLELTISLAIISMLLVMSTVGLISLRESLQVNAATQGLYDALQLARSYAINNVTYMNTDTNTPEVPTMFTISLGSTEGTVKLMYCNLQTNQKVASISLDSNCTTIDDNVFETDISGVNISNQISDGLGCEAVGFLTGTGEIYVKQTGSDQQFLSYSNVSLSTPDKAMCKYLITNQDSLTSRTVYIETNAINQTIKKK
ncbi:MAG: prepilin-type N-terminal cleavage/methylation domain-containing protein [bacterium]